MTKRLMLLGGLAILAVVFNHAAGWGNTALFWWTDRYRDVETPCFDQIGSPAYYALLVIAQLATFSVPVFLFISGFFIAYAARGTKMTLGWRSVGSRIRYLLIPYLIWSVLIFLAEGLEGQTYAPWTYLEKLVTGRATPAYYYVPLICQFYLLSPFLIRLAREQWKMLLLAAALVQVGGLTLRYLDVFGVDSPLVDFLKPLTAAYLFPTSAFYFAVGLVAGLRVRPLQRWLSTHQPHLIVALFLTAPLAVLEPEFIYRVTGRNWIRGQTLLMPTLYALAFIFTFLATQKLRLPAEKKLQWLSKRSYGIYMLHPKALEYGARGIRLLVPWLLARQALFQPLLILLGLGLPVLLIMAVLQSPARKHYRTLFG